MLLSRNYRYQFLATLCANIISVTFGTVSGWTAASFPDLLSETDSPMPDGLPLNMEQLSWVGSSMAIGALFGNSFYSWLADRCGRKSALIYTAVPNMIGWGLLIFAQNVYYLYASRFLLGLAGAGSFVVIPLYVSEIADTEVRGSLGSLLVFTCNIGILISFVVGYLVSYAWRPILLLVFPIGFLLSFVNFPETPAFLLRQGREEEAQKSLRYYRNLPDDDESTGTMLKVAIEELRRMHQPSSDIETSADIGVADNSTDWSAFNTRHGRKALVIGVALIVSSMLCGCFVLLTYSADVFFQSGITMSSNLAAILMGVIQLCGAYVSTVLVDRTGRKFLLIVSALGSFLGLFAIATYIRYLQAGYDLTAYDWIPLASFGFLVFIANCGLTTLPFLVIAEVMPERIRTIGCSLCMSQLYTVGFVMLKSFPMMVEWMGMYGYLYGLAAGSLAAAAFVHLMVPETRGKSFETIRRTMEK